MDDNSNLAKNFKEKSIDNLSDVGYVFQPFWVRYSSIWPNSSYREFILRKCYFVLYSGLIFWLVYFISKAF
jgi:hypothetical protein